ncbi:MAG TPA: hypothetical protein VEK38_04675 [Candidatus Bathyarchaeia archaeon]|nr:hypothetical protein [Candidatus Bathyarchaeia archaeon]
MKHMRTYALIAILFFPCALFGMESGVYEEKCNEIVGYITLDTFINAQHMLAEYEKSVENEHLQESATGTEMSSADAMEKVQNRANERIAQKFRQYIEAHIIAQPKTGIMVLGSVFERYLHGYMYHVNGVLVMESLGLKDLLYNSGNKEQVCQDIQRTMAQAVKAVLLGIAQFGYIDSFVPVVMNNMEVVCSLLEEDEWHALGIALDTYVEDAHALANQTLQNIIEEEIRRAEIEKNPRVIEKLYHDYFTELLYIDGDELIKTRPLKELLFTSFNQRSVDEAISHAVTQARKKLKLFQTRITLETVDQQLDMMQDILKSTFSLDNAVATKRFIIQSSQLFTALIPTLKQAQVHETQGRLRMIRQTFNEKLKDAFVFRINDMITSAGNRGIANFEPLLLDYVQALSYKKNDRLMWADVSVKKLFFNARNTVSLCATLEEKLQTATRTVCTRIVGLYKTLDDLIPVVMHNISVISDMLSPELWEDMHIPIERIIIQTKMKINERTKTLIMAGINEGSQEEVAALQEMYEEGCSYIDTDGENVVTVGIATLLYDVSNKKAVQDSLSRAFSSR